MYLWVVLATFLAMIAGYYLPLRSDTHDIINVPPAQAKLVQMVAQHKSARKWVLAESFPMTCYKAAENKYCGENHENCTCNEAAMSPEEKGKFPYNSGTEVTEDMLLTYAPLGFVYDDSYTTVLYCSSSETAYSLGSSCDTGGANNTFRLLITTGPVPEKWRTYDDSGNFVPSADFMTAMRSQFFSTEKAGYAVKQGGAAVGDEIINADGGTDSIPAGAPQAKVANCLDTYGSCLVEISTM